MPRRLCYTIEDMQRLALSKSGMCLSREYFNLTTPLVWQCKYGHKWTSRPCNIVSGKWCPKCGSARVHLKGSYGSVKKRYTLGDLKNLAITHHGYCLEEEYLGLNIKHKWQCERGHQWLARPSSVLYMKTWCPFCAFERNAGTQRDGIENMYALAESRGGKCLSTKYLNATKKLDWECNRGHVWEATPSNVKNGSWCRICSNNQKIHPHRQIALEQMRELARKRGGLCLSKNYKNSVTVLEWQCRLGHTWRASASSIINMHTWCPVCSGKSRLKENLCRGVFSLIFNSEFPTRRPRWLKSPRGYCMELDGYSEALGIAFEYNGVQHYKTHKFMMKTKDELNLRQKNDEYKAMLCAEKKIKLFVVPYSIPIDKLPMFIIEKCQTLRITNYNEINFSDMDLSNYYLRDELEELRDIARQKGGELLSEVYLGANTPLRWRCNAGHTWETSPHHIKTSGSWCQKCAALSSNKDRCLGIEKMHEIAHARAGKCLSTKYVNTKTTLKWQCANGHTWIASPSNIISRKSWCPKCKHRNI